MIAIIPAGGCARRLQTISRETPKPPLGLVGKPIVDYIFKAEVEDQYYGANQLRMHYTLGEHTVAHARIEDKSAGLATL